MRSHLLLFVISAIVIAVLLMLLPWWSTVIVGLIAGYLSSVKSRSAFLLLFFAGFLAWGASAWFVDGQYSKSVAALLADMGLGKAIFAYLATAVLGGLTAGLAAVLSSSLVNTMQRR